MSYILSALKKAERHRKVEEPPSVLSVQVTEASPKASWKWLQVSAVVLSGMAIAAIGAWYLSNWILSSNWNFFQASQQPVASQLQSPPQPSQTPSAFDSFGQPRPADQQPQQPVTKIPDTVGLQDEVLPNRQEWGPSDPYLRPNEQTGEILDFHRLSSELRSQIPAFTVSGYLYSATRPSANKVIINGIALREGQYVNDELMVKRINADHIVMDYRGLLFRISRDQLSQY